VAEIDHNRAVREIILALKGPVAEVFRKLVPAFQDIRPGVFYESVIANSEMLHGCLLIFRKRREAFSHLLVDADGRTVNDDFVRLRCDRSVHDIIAMIVRTHAKQHFRATLGDDPNDPSSRSGRLYRAMNEYLIHEWQVPLAASYARLPVDTVAKLGPALLDLKSSAAVDAVVTAVTAAPSAAEMSAVQVSAHAPANDTAPALEQNEADFWWETLNDPIVRNALGSMSETEMRELTGAFCGVGEAARSQLLTPLGFSLQQAAVVFTALYRSMGRATFTQVLGKPGNPAGIADVTKRLQARNINSRTDLKSLLSATEAALSVSTRGGKAAARQP